jgi:tellurium resistance protein TerD
MSISLTKGDLFTLTDSQQHLLLGLGWDARSSDGAPFDLDAVVFMLNASNQVNADTGFIFYNQPQSTCGGVTHQGDNRIGDANGDDEVVQVELSKIPANVEKLIFAVTIHEYDVRKQNFGQVRRAYIRLVNQKTKAEIARFDLTEDASIGTAMVFGELHRLNQGWKFKASADSKNCGLLELAQSYGVKL